MYAEKLPPHDISAEEAVIASLLIDSEAITTIASFLTGEDFYREINRWCYEACLSLYGRNEAINQITVADELTRQNRLEEIGGPAYLSHLVSIVPTSVHIQYYARIVHRMATMRHLIDAAGQIATIGFEAGPDEDSALSKAEDILFHLRRGQSPRDFVHIRDVLDKYLEDSGFGPEPKEGEVSSIETGFVDLDDLTGGFQRSDLIILAARPSMGKSTLALNIARNAAMKQGARVAIFSLEMGKEQVVQRLLASESGVDSQRLRLGRHTEAEERKVMDATGILAQLLIYVDDSPLLNIVEMRSKARRLHLERGIDFLIVDYLQLMQGSSSKENRVQEMSEISRSLKGLARELNLPVLALSQLRRAVEDRPSRRPLLSDLRESGSIEQDADVVIFIYRDDIYFSRDEWERRFPEKPYPKGIADLIVSKHRHGPTGERQLYFESRTVKFTNLAQPTTEPSLL